MNDFNFQEVFQYSVRLSILTFIFNFSLTFGQLTQVSNNPASDWDPSWSPDGDSLVFTSNRNGNDDLWIIPVNGGAATQLTFSQSGDYHPCWSPISSVIAYCSEQSGNQDIWTILSRGGSATRVTNYL